MEDWPSHISCTGVPSCHSTRRLKWPLAHTDGPSASRVCSRSRCEWPHCCAHSGAQLVSQKVTDKNLTFISDSGPGMKQPQPKKTSTVFSVKCEHVVCAAKPEIRQTCNHVTWKPFCTLGQIVLLHHNNSFPGSTHPALSPSPAGRSWATGAAGWAPWPWPGPRCRLPPRPHRTCWKKRWRDRQVRPQLMAADNKTALALSKCRNQSWKFRTVVQRPTVQAANGPLKLISRPHRGQVFVVH